MKNLTLGQKILSAVLGIFAMFGVYQTANLGGASDTYTATTTSSAWAGLHIPVKYNSPAVLGSICVASTTGALPLTQTLTLWNATSTTDSASTTIAVIQTGYTGCFGNDLNFPQGLIISAGAGFAGSYTIGYR